MIPDEFTYFCNLRSDAPRLIAGLRAGDFASLSSADSTETSISLGVVGSGSSAVGAGLALSAASCSAIAAAMAGPSESVESRKESFAASAEARTFCGKDLSF